MIWTHRPEPGAKGSTQKAYQIRNLISTNWVSWKRKKGSPIKIHQVQNLMVRVALSEASDRWGKHVLWGFSFQSFPPCVGEAATGESEPDTSAPDESPDGPESVVERADQALAGPPPPPPAPFFLFFFLGVFCCAPAAGEGLRLGDSFRCVAQVVSAAVRGSCLNLH